MLESKIKSSLLASTEKILNDQVAVEGVSSASYLSMASWCDVKGYSYSADFMYKHAEEEKSHMMKIFRYINDRGGMAISPSISSHKQEFESLKEVFQCALKYELQVTDSINKIVEHCLAVKDFSTFNFMQWFVAEQVEEELITRRACELFDIIGTEGTGLYLIDKAISKIESDEK